MPDTKTKPKRMKTSFSINIAATTRRETLHGRSHLVAPVTLIVSGVLAGSRGALYYPPETLKNSADYFSGTFLTYGHPKISDGKHILVRDPKVLNEFGVGFVFGVQYNPAKKCLEGEAWFDEALCDQRDSRILGSLRSGKPLEVSVGVRTVDKLAPKGANHNGTEYWGEVQSMVPDHLAVLLDQRGACSLKDGCGIRLNSRPNVKDLTTILNSLPKGKNTMDTNELELLIPPKMVFSSHPGSSVTTHHYNGNPDILPLPVMNFDESQPASQATDESSGLPLLLPPSMTF